ncbi:MAG: PD40 domain-containing protein [Bacteroidetes bacterium]|nr:PD40 domain-containing protein [Bacteroidota bacterium]
MTNYRLIICLMLLSLFSNYTANSQGNLGIVAPFLPDVFSRFPVVRDLTMTADGSEVYFTAQSPLSEISSIVCMKKKMGKWLEPELTNFSSGYQDMEPFISHDGKKLYFVSNRPLDQTTKADKDFDIWLVERKDVESEWTAPVNLGLPVNSKENEFYPSVAISGNLYFTCDGPNSKGKDDIFISKFINGNYAIPVSVGDAINTEGYEFNAFVAPDESFLLFTCYNRKDGFGSGDLYISFSSSPASWSEPLNLGPEINSPQMDYCPFMAGNTDFLYFTSKRNTIQPISTTNPSMNDLLHELNKYDNGSSRIYIITNHSFIKK